MANKMLSWHKEDKYDLDKIVEKKSLLKERDIFSKEFDKGWSSKINDKDFKKHWFVLPDEPQVVDDKSIVYSYNSDRFRCDEFKSNHENKKHILFAGCSETEGVGSPLNTVWSKIIYNKLSESDDLSGYFSLAKSGWGWQKIINNFIIYSEKYGFPEYFIVLLPRISRLYIWEDDNWIYKQKIFNHKTKDINLSKKEHRELWINFITGWKLFELYCNSNNVKLLWSSWDYIENENLENTENYFNNYFSIKNNQILEYAKKVRPDGKFLKYDIDRRDGHNGVIEHECYAELYLEQIKKRWSFL